jgi:hypothetical protein
MISIVDPFCPSLVRRRQNHHVAAGPAAVQPMPIRYLFFTLAGEWAVSGRDQS